MPNPICHWELMVNDAQKSKAFYRKVFDWKFDETSSRPGVGWFAMFVDPDGIPVGIFETKAANA